jgi:PAS domain S-box-containing protein
MQPRESIAGNGTLSIKIFDSPGMTTMAANTDAKSALHSRHAGARVLVVDDEPMNVELTQVMLEDAGLQVDTAQDGAEAIAMTRATKYAAVLTDLQMPNVDGFEATRKIRQIPGYQATPIIALTASNLADETARCKAAGIDTVLTKPFDFDELFTVLLTHLPTHQNAATATETPWQTLRERAEALARKKAAHSKENLTTLSTNAFQALIHELRVHQIELEMQNDELRQTQGELEALRAHYADLYDRAPVGYCTLDESSIIREVNLMAANLLGLTREQLVACPITKFIATGSQDVFSQALRQTSATDTPQTCYLQLVHPEAAMDATTGSTPFWVGLAMTGIENADDQRELRLVINDISGHALPH